MALSHVAGSLDNSQGLEGARSVCVILPLHGLTHVYCSVSTRRQTKGKGLSHLHCDLTCFVLLWSDLPLNMTLNIQRETDEVPQLSWMNENLYRHDLKNLVNP